MGGILGAGASILGSVLGSSAAGDAADAQSAAAANSLKLQKEMYDQTRTDLAPYRDLGNAGWTKLAELMGLYNPNSPTSTSTVVGGAPAAAAASASASGSGGHGRNPLWTLYDPSTTEGKRGVGTYSVINPRRETVMTPYGIVTYNSSDGKVHGSNSKAVSWYYANGGGAANAAAGSGAAAGSASTAPPSDFGSLMKKFSETDWQTDPGYQFRLGEGQKAIDHSLAAQGGLLSGAAMKAASKYNQDFASNEYQNVYNRYNTDNTNIYNRLMGIADKGQQAAAGSASNNQNYANQGGSAYTAMGNAQANGAINQGYFMNQGIQGLGGLFGGGSSYGGYNGSPFIGGPKQNTGQNYGAINWFS